MELSEEALKADERESWADTGSGEATGPYTA
jgi:hypothetical protein